MIIYHNPRCTKSRETLKLIEDKGIKPKVVEYLKNPPSAAELKNIIKLLGVPVMEIVRKKEDAYKESGISKAVSDDKIIEILVKNPTLIERPIVVSGNKAAIGRPPENVLAILPGRLSIT